MTNTAYYFDQTPTAEQREHVQDLFSRAFEQIFAARARANGTTFKVSFAPDNGQQQATAEELSEFTAGR